MNNIQFYLDLVKQIVLISSVLSGFAALTTAAFMMLSDKNRYVTLEIGFFGAAGLSLITTTSVGAFLLFASRYLLTSLNNVTLSRVDIAFWVLWFTLAIGLFFFIVGLGLSGWVHSSNTGVFTSVLMVIVLVVVILMMMSIGSVIFR